MGDAAPDCCPSPAGSLFGKSTGEGCIDRPVMFAINGLDSPPPGGAPMEKPSDKKRRSEETPPGGRAFQRGHQARLARGPDNLRVPGTPRWATDKFPSTQPAGEKRRKK